MREGEASETLSGGVVRGRAEVNLARRALIKHAGWAVPIILAVGVPAREAKAIYGEFFAFETDERVAEATREICEVETGRPCDVIPIAPDLFFIADP